MRPARCFIGLLIAIGAIGCGSLGPPAASGKHASAGQCTYDASLTSLEPALLDVSVRCSGRELSGFSISENAAAPYVKNVETADGEALGSKGYRWQLPDEAATVSIRYRVDLEGIAREIDHFDVAQRVGKSVVAPASTWLLRPEPVDLGVPVTVRVRTPPGVRFTTGLRSAGDGWSLEAHEIRTATYAVFGEFEQYSIELQKRPGMKRSVLDVAVLDAPLEASDAALQRWIADSARAVAAFWGGFPVERALLVVMPVRGREGVLFGKVLPESAPGIALLVGQHTKPERLYDDWVLVHELFHLGFPSFNGEGKWLDEGLATYYEPLIRARNGWKTEESVWGEFVRAMPQAMRAGRVGGLEKASSYREIYWGGAIVALLADVEARKRSGGKLGLEHGLTAVLAAGGEASQVWPLERVIKLIDAQYSEPLLAPLLRAHAYDASRVDLEALWARLGVVPTQEGVVLDDRAPLAWVRKSVVYGASAARRVKP